MRRTTVVLDEELYRRAKKTAVDQRQSFKRLLESALVSYLSKPLIISPKKKKSPKFGVYRATVRGSLRREDLYDEFLRHKVQ